MPKIHVTSLHTAYMFVTVCVANWCNPLCCLRWRQHMSGRVDKAQVQKKKAIRRLQPARIKQQRLPHAACNPSPTESRGPSVWCPSLHPLCTPMISAQLSTFGRLNKWHSPQRPQTFSALHESDPCPTITGPKFFQLFLVALVYTFRTEYNRQPLLPKYSSVTHFPHFPQQNRRLDPLHLPSHAIPPNTTYSPLPLFLATTRPSHRPSLRLVGATRNQGTLPKSLASPTPPRVVSCDPI